MRRTVKYATVLMAGLMMTVWGGTVALAGEWNFTGPESWQWEYRDDNGSRAGAGWKEIDGKWYYFNEIVLQSTWNYDEKTGTWHYDAMSKHKPYGAMYSDEMTPDRYVVGKDGAWDGREKK